MKRLFFSQFPDLPRTTHAETKEKYLSALYGLYADEGKRSLLPQEEMIFL